MSLLVARKGASHIHVFSAQAVLAGGSVDSDPIDIRGIDGYLSLGWTITGDGTAKFEILSCLDGSNYLDVSPDIAAAQTKITGPGTNGINAALITTIPAPFIKIRVTETGGANAVTVTVHLYGN